MTSAQLAGSGGVVREPTKNRAGKTVRGGLRRAIIYRGASLA